METPRIEGSVALVTGANRGLGRALTEALLIRGARKVYTTARDPQAITIQGSTALEHARREIEVNYLGPLRLLHHLAPSLATNGGGAVVHVGSLGGLTSLPLAPTYSASKAALHSLTQAARALLRAQGTAVVGVYPGPVDTDMSRELADPKASPRDVAFAILDGLEAGHEDIFPDAFAAEFARQFAASPKESERQMAATISAMVWGPIA